MKRVIALCLLGCFLSSCVVFRIGGLATSTLLEENDPELVAEALPAFIKTVEVLYLDNPNNEANAKILSNLYLLYGNMILGTKAFLLQNADPLESSKIAARAVGYSVKAKRTVLPFIKKRSPKLFTTQIQLSEKPSKETLKLVSMFSKKDIDLLYAAAASIFASFSGNPLDFDTANLLPGAFLLLDRALTLDPNYGNGRLLSLAFSVYAGLPEVLGGNRARALEYFSLLVTLSKETNAGIYVDYALNFSLLENDKEGFVTNLNKAITIANNNPVLMNVLAMQKAQSILADLYLYFPE